MTRHSLALTVSSVAAVLFLLPAPGAADVRLTPFAGVTFLEDLNKPTFGAAITIGGMVSVELDAARTELGSFAEIPAVELTAHATTLMGNLVVRFPGPIQPYVSGGAGLVRVTGSVDVPFLGSLVSASAQDVGWNVGGGIYILPTPNFGIRADVRRFQTGDLSWDEITDIEGVGDVPLPKFDFWRATAGITFKF